MKEIEPYIGEDGEVRELDDAWFKQAKRGRPPILEKLRKRRVNLMLSPDVIEALKARGAMSTEADKIFREALGL